MHYENFQKRLFIFCSKIVLVAIQDAGSTYISPALDALKRLGAKDPILTDFRGSFALVGYAQPSKPSWIAEEQQKRYEGPSEIFMRIPLMQSRQPRKILVISAFKSLAAMEAEVAELASCSQSCTLRSQYFQSSFLGFFGNSDSKSFPLDLLFCLLQLALSNARYFQQCFSLESSNSKVQLQQQQYSQQQQQRQGEQQGVALVVGGASVFAKRGSCSNEKVLHMKIY